MDKFGEKIKAFLDSATNILSKVEHLFSIVKYRTLSGRIVNFREMFGNPTLNAILGIVNNARAIIEKVNPEESS